MYMIEDRSSRERGRFVLHVGNARGVAEAEQRGREVVFRWNIAGPIELSESKAILMGMLDLAVTADALATRIEHEKVKTTRTRRASPRSEEDAEVGSGDGSDEGEEDGGPAADAGISRRRVR